MSTIRYTQGGNYDADASREAIILNGSIADLNQNSIQVVTNGDSQYILTDGDKTFSLVTDETIPGDQSRPLSSESDGIYVDMSDIPTNLRLWSGEMGDVLIGGAGDDSLKGGGGSDILEGGIGDNDIQGGSGVDTVSYEHFNSGTNGISVLLNDGLASDRSGDGFLDDTLSDIENIRGSARGDALYGDSENNVIEGGAGADIIHGMPGTDTATYRHSSAGVTVDLGTGAGAGGDAQGDVLTEIENLFGSTHDDSLTGDTEANTLNGNGGSDSLFGMGGDDRLVITDTPTEIDGGGGKDFLFVSGGGFVSLGGATFTGIEAVFVRNDTHLDMSAVSTGTAITSQSTAGHGVDIVGGSGNDRIQAGKGGDTLEGGAGGDKLLAGLGNDTFVFETGFGRDNVYKFAAGFDHFDVSALVDSFGEIEISQMKNGVDTLITFDGSATGNKIILHDVVASTLKADDFGFLIV